MTLEANCAMGQIFFNNPEDEAILFLSDFLGFEINESCLRRIKTKKNRTNKTAKKKNGKTTARKTSRRAKQQKFQDDKKNPVDHYVASAERREAVKKRSLDAISEHEKMDES